MADNRLRFLDHTRRRSIAASHGRGSGRGNPAPPRDVSSAAPIRSRPSPPRTAPGRGDASRCLVTACATPAPRQSAAQIDWTMRAQLRHDARPRRITERCKYGRSRDESCIEILRDELICGETPSFAANARATRSGMLSGPDSVIISFVPRNFVEHHLDQRRRLGGVIDVRRAQRMRRARSSASSSCDRRSVERAAAIRLLPLRGVGDPSSASSCRTCAPATNGPRTRRQPRAELLRVLIAPPARAAPST